MNPCEKTLSSLKPHNCPRRIEGWPIPSISHSVGTNKLLGERLGLAIYEECGLTDKKILKDFTVIGGLLRSFIVIDDFAKDHNISIENCPELNQWLNSIKLATISYLQPYCPSASSLWKRYEEEYHEAYYSFSATKLFESVIKKCHLIFLIFELSPICDNIKSKTLQGVLEKYLFSLQCMDDFHDMEEDLIAPRNHNIFSISIPHQLIEKVITRRAPLARLLLPYIKQELECLLVDIDSSTAQDYIRHSIEWIIDRYKILKISDESISVFYKPLKTFTFTKAFVKNDLLKFEAEDLPQGIEIRAEVVHTLQQ